MRLHPSFVLPTFPYETPMGYVSRICLRLGYTPRRFCASIGVTYRSLVDGDPAAVGALGRACGLADDAFADGTIVTLPGKRYRIRGEVLAMDQMQRENLRVCPCCIEEQIEEGNSASSAHTDVRWHILPLHVCHVHRVPIGTIVIDGDRSPRQAHNFSWRLQQQMRHGALLDLDRTETAPSSLSTYANDRLFGAPETHWLSGMPLYASIKISQIIGAELMKVHQRRWGGMSAALLHEVGGVGFDALRKGEDGLREVLSVAQKEYFASHSRTGKLSMFGRLYSFLAHDCDDPAYEPAREVLRQHIIEEMPVGPGDTALGKLVETRLIHSAWSVAPELGLNPVTTLRRLIRVGILDSSTDHLSPDQRTFEVVKHVEQLRRLKSAFLRADAGRYIGMSPLHPGITAVLDLVGSLNIEKMPTTQQLYAKEDLDHFMSSVLDKASCVKDATGFAVIALAAAKAKSSVVAIIEMIRDGRVRDVRISPDHQGILSLMVRPADVRANIVEERTWVTWAEAQKMLRVSEKTLRELVQHKVILAREAPRIGFEMAELRAFSDKYITTSEMHRVYRKLREIRDTRWTPNKAMTDAGATPIYQRNRYPIYRRDQVIAVLGPPNDPAY